MPTALAFLTTIPHNNYKGRILSSGPSRGLVVRCSRPVNFTNCLGYGTPRCLNIKMHPVPSKTTMGEGGMPGSQALKGLTHTSNNIFKMEV